MGNMASFIIPSPGTKREVGRDSLGTIDGTWDKKTHPQENSMREEGGNTYLFRSRFFQMAVWVNHLPLTVEFTLNVTYSDELPARTLLFDAFMSQSWKKKSKKKRACFVSCSIKSNLPSNNWGTFCKPYALEAFSRRTFPRDYSFVDIRSLEK